MNSADKSHKCLTDVAWGGDHSGVVSPASVGISCTAAGLDLIVCQLPQVPLWDMIYSSDKLGFRKLRLFDFYNDILIVVYPLILLIGSNIKYIWAKKMKKDPRNAQKKLLF